MNKNEDPICIYLKLYRSDLFSSNQCPMFSSYSIQKQCLISKHTANHFIHPTVSNLTLSHFFLFYPKAIAFVDLFSPVNKRCVGCGNNPFQEIRGNKNLKKHCPLVFTPKGNGNKNHTVYQLRDHSAEVIA